MEVHYKFKEARKACGLTLKEVAQALNVTAATYSRYENGLIQPDLETLKCIAVLMKTSVDFLLGNESSVPDLPQDANELLALYGKMDDKFKIRLLGTAYAMLAEQKVNSNLNLDIIRKAAK